jgi:hypothetical protein
VPQRVPVFARWRPPELRRDRFCRTGRGLSRKPAVPGSITRRHRLPALSWSRTGARRCGEVGRCREWPSRDREPAQPRSPASARDLHAMPPRIDEQRAAVPNSALRASTVFVRAGAAARGLLYSFRSRAWKRPRRQVRDCGWSVPPTQVGVFSAQRDDVFHLPRPARHSPRSRRSDALHGGLRKLSPRAAPRWSAAGAGRCRGRDVHRLSHAEAAHGRRGACGDDRPLHSAAAAVARSSRRSDRG